jgi:hypothetical protein
MLSAGPLRALTTRLLAVALLAVATVAAGVVVAGPVQAAKCTDGDKPIFDRTTKTLIYPCERAGRTTPGRDGRDASNAGTGAPSCNLVPPATYCVGGAACYIKDSVVPFLPPKSPPPKPDADWVVRICVNADGSGGGEAIWLTDDLPVEPPLSVQAAEAVGELRLPRIRFETDPPVRSIVNIETRFTATGDVDDPLEGSSAFGLVAIATLETWHVDTGDGTTLSCSVQDAACAHTYARASIGQAGRDGDGRPAYAVRSYGTWAIAYEVDGDPVDIPEAPQTIDGPVTTVPVAVAEIQSVVVGSQP